MGLFKAWKEVKAIAATGAPTGAPPGRAQRRPQGTMAGFAGVMMKMMGPMLAAQAPERGGPLAGTEAGVFDAQDPGVMQAAIAAVRGRDAAFDPQVLTSFADQVFAATSSVWGTGDASTVRSLLADDLWEPLSATLASGLGAGIGAMYSRQKGRSTLTGVWAGACYDTARFNLAVTVDLPPDAQHEVPPGFDNWTEDWLFQRSVQPGGQPMMLAAACPSCGAPTSVDAAGLCTHCHQPVPVQTAGWLVTSIRSHNPAVEMFRAQAVTHLQQNPAELQMMPDDLVKLLPADAVAAIDPARAAALGLRPTR